MRPERTHRQPGGIRTPSLLVAGKTPIAISETIQRSLRAGPPPPYDELVSLEQTLLLAITELWGAADKAEQQCSDASSTALRRARLASIRSQSAVGLGTGLISAQMQVRALARDCRWLLDQQTPGAQ